MSEQTKVKQSVRAALDERNVLHPRNPHRGRYDFGRLVACMPVLANFVSTNEYGNETIDFANPLAVRALNSALLKLEYGIDGWDIPAGNLCPPIPGRADYLHYLADLLMEGSEILRGPSVRVLDIGVGANCIYPLIGQRAYGWSFVGSDINRAALANARRIVDANGLDGVIELRLQASCSAVFGGVMLPSEFFDLTMCNPPFHASPDDARAGTQRKWRNLGKQSGVQAALNFGGLSAELYCEGGEEAFIGRMVAESAMHPTSCLWYTSLVSKSATLPAVYRALEKVGIRESRTIDMAQGQKKSRIVAWTFLDETRRREWRAMRLK